MHGGAPGSGAPRGNRNALKHGRYSATAIARRRYLRTLIREGPADGQESLTPSRPQPSAVLAGARSPLPSLSPKKGDEFPEAELGRASSNDIR